MKEGDWDNGTLAASATGVTDGTAGNVEEAEGTAGQDAGGPFPKALAADRKVGRLAGGSTACPNDSGGSVSARGLTLLPETAT